MNDRRSTDHLLSAWFEAEAPAFAPDVLRTDIDCATARIRPRPVWLARLGGHHMDVLTGGARRRDTRLVPILALLGLLIAAAVAAVYIGSHPRNDLAVVPPPPSPAATPAATGSPSSTPTPAFLSYADLALTMPYPIRQVQLGLGGNYVGVAGEDTNELLRSIYRVNTSTNSRSLVVDDIPVEPRDHVSFAASGNRIVIGHDEGNRALRYDAQSGELLGESPLGERPLDATVFADRVWFPNFGDGSVAGVDPRTGEAVTIPIPQFGGMGPLALAADAARTGLWAISPSSPTLVRINRESESIELEIPLPAGTYCGVAISTGRVWVTGCEGSPPLLGMHDAYTALQGAEPVAIGPGVLSTVFEADDRVWFATEDRTNAQWTTTLVPVDPVTLAVGAPIDLGARVGVVSTGSGVWLMSGTHLYRLRLDELPSG